MKKIYLIFALALMLSLFGGCGGTEKTVLDPPTAQSQGPSSSQEASPLPSQMQEVKLYLNGNRLELSTAPVVEGDFVMVPFAEICESFSRQISVTQEGAVLTLVDTENSNTIVITDGESKATVNGSSVDIKAPAELTQDGVFLVELSSFRTLLDADNKYQADISTAYITESGLC